MEAIWLESIVGEKVKKSSDIDLVGCIFTECSVQPVQLQGGRGGVSFSSLHDEIMSNNHNFDMQRGVDTRYF